MPALKLKDKDGNWITLPTIKGEDGKDGKSAYQQAVEAGYTGTEAAFYAALVSLKDGPFLPVRYDGAIFVETIHIGTDYAPAIEGHANADGNDPYFVLYGSMDRDCRISGVSPPTYNQDAANKGYVDGKAPLLFTGKTVTASAWVSNSTYSAQGYNWRVAVVCTGVTASHRPDVAFGAADAVSGNFAPVADSYAGGVYLYCKTKPTATVTIPSIVCVKGA